MSIRSLALAAAVAAVTLPTLATAADQDGTGLMVRARAIGVLPQTSSTITPIGGKADATNEWVPEVDLSYFVTPNIAFELIAATTRHTLSAKNTALGGLTLGKVQVLPPTLTAQWHFLPGATVNPYVGAGINYTFFFDAKAAGGAIQNISVENNVGGALQAGVDIALGGRWYANVDVKQLFLNTKVKVNGGAVRADVDLNPTIVGLGIGYKF